jgi:Radical SAM superfamily
MSPKYRFRSVGSLMTELEHLYAAEPFGHVSFSDPNFFVHFRRTLEFSRALHAWRPEITWSGTATADFVARHAEVLDEIGGLNCASLELGVESGNDSVLQRFNKRTTVDQNLRAIELLEGAGIALELDFIMFDPESTLDELRENLSFLRRAGLLGHHPADHLYNALKIYPGTPARDRYIEMFGLRPNHLMKLTPPFLNPDVACVHRLATNFFRVHQSRIDAELRRLESLLRNPTSAVEEDLKAMALAAVALRHVPYQFFEELLDGVADGALPLDASLAESELASVEQVDRLLSGDWSPERSLPPVAVSRTSSSPAAGLVPSGAFTAADHQGVVYLVSPRGEIYHLNTTASTRWRLAKENPMDIEQARAGGSMTTVRPDYWRRAPALLRRYFQHRSTSSSTFNASTAGVVRRPWRGSTCERRRSPAEGRSPASSQIPNTRARSTSCIGTAATDSPSS